MRNQNIKVRVADLITKIETARDEAEKRYETDFTKLAKEHEATVKVRIKALEKLLKAARAGEKVGIENLEMFRRYSSGLNFGPLERPKKFDTSEYDKDIAFLKLAAEDTITISSNSNFLRYL